MVDTKTGRLALSEQLEVQPMRCLEDCGPLDTDGRQLVDVRSTGEYTGELLHMPDYPQEGALRGGHIHGAVSVPWSKSVNEDGTFHGLNDAVSIQYGLEAIAAARGIGPLPYIRGNGSDVTVS